MLLHRAARTILVHWKRALAVVIAMVLLLPVPAFAITFLGTWSVTQSQTGGAPAATYTSGDFSGGGFLNVDMKAYRVGFFDFANSKVIASRSFTSPGEALTFSLSFVQQIRSWSLDVTVGVDKAGGGGFEYPFVRERAPENVSRIINYSSSTTTNIGSGTYTVNILIQTAKSRFGRGGWANISPFSFVFTGV